MSLITSTSCHGASVLPHRSQYSIRRSVLFVRVHTQLRLRTMFFISTFGLLQKRTYIYSTITHRYPTLHRLGFLSSVLLGSWTPSCYPSLHLCTTSPSSHLISAVVSRSIFADMSRRYVGFPRDHVSQLPRISVTHLAPVRHQYHRICSIIPHLLCQQDAILSCHIGHRTHM